MADTYRAVLGRADVTPTSTFVSLGGDSLSYVECSVRLERRLGRLPADWAVRSVGELDALEHRRGLPRLDATVLLRTVGILLVVSTHMFLWYFPGGAHLMLAVAGYNTSRFHLSIDGTRQRAAAVLRSIGRLAAPIAAFVALCMLLVGGYGVPTLLFVNNYLGPVTHQQSRWQFWFVEAIVQILVLVLVVLAIGPIHRFDRRFPFLFPLLLLGGALVLREQWVAIGGYHNLRFQTHGVLWFFVLGWLVHRATRTWQRVVVTALCVLTLPGFFISPERGWFIAAGLVLLVWWREVPVPRIVIRPVAAVAAASLAIYVSHFRVFPPLARNLPVGWAYVATVAVGVGIWSGWELASRHARRLAGTRRERQPTTVPTRAVVAVAVD